jgi:hypothetical protein
MRRPVAVDPLPRDGGIPGERVVQRARRVEQIPVELGQRPGGEPIAVE